MTNINMTPQTQIALMNASQASAAQASAKTKQAKDMAKIDAAAQDFEAMYLTEMMKPMFEDVNKPDPIFGGGKGEEIFNGMMVEQYGKIMAQAGGVGLAKYVKAEM
ncbi:MAG TPA: rod-binding protein, partial [Alphaproteobacteria bacterium]